MRCDGSDRECVVTEDFYDTASLRRQQARGKQFTKRILRVCLLTAGLIATLESNEVT